MPAKTGRFPLSFPEANASLTPKQMKQLNSSQERDPPFPTRPSKLRSNGTPSFSQTARKQSRSKERKDSFPSKELHPRCEDIPDAMTEQKKESKSIPFETAEQIICERKDGKPLKEQIRVSEREGIPSLEQKSEPCKSCERTSEGSRNPNRTRTQCPSKKPSNHKDSI